MHGYVTSRKSLGAIRRELIKQRLGLLKISGVKTLGKPTVDRSEQVVSVLVFALGLPQASETHRGPEFPGLRCLPTGYLQGLLETAFCLTRVRGRLLQQQFTFEPVQLSLAVAWPHAVNQRQCLPHCSQPFGDLA